MALWTGRGLLAQAKLSSRSAHSVVLVLSLLLLPLHHLSDALGTVHSSVSSLQLLSCAPDMTASPSAADKTHRVSYCYGEDSV